MITNYLYLLTELTYSILHFLFLTVCFTSILFFCGFDYTVLNLGLV